MATTTNYSWSTPDDTALVKDGAAAIRSLGTAIDTTVFTNAGAAVAKATVDAKGDLIAGTADNTIARLAVGANGTTLVANSSTATGLEWVTPASGGMSLISETVASANSAINLTGISGSYKQLLLVYAGIQHSATGSTFALRFNNDSTADAYESVGFRVRGSTIDQAAASYTSLKSDVSGVGTLSFGENASANLLRTASSGFILIDNYASTTKTKAITAMYSYYDNNNAVYNTANCSFFWNDTSAITSLDIVRLSGSATISNISNSSIRLYGVA